MEGRMGSDEEVSIADAILFLGRAVDRLGNADAATPMGGLEALGKVVGEGCHEVAAALTDIAEAIDNMVRESAK